MRWFIALLVLANVALFFWLQHESLPEEPVALLPPPDIGRLELLPADTRNPIDEQIAQVAKESSALPAEQPIESAEPPGEASSTRVEQDAPVEDDQPTVVANSDAIQDNPGPSDSAVTQPEPITGAVDQQVDTASAASGRAIDELAELEARTDPPEIDDRVAEQPAVTAAEALVDAPQEPVVGAGIEAIDVAPAVEPVPDEQLLTDSRDDGIPEADPVTAVCAQVGPLTTDQAEQLVAELPVFITLLSDFAQEVRTVDAYYVMIPALGSRAEGLQMLDALEDSGITDTWLFPRGRFRNAISLGLFSRQSGALRWQQEVVARGFDAQIVERSKTNEQRRLLLKNVDGGDIALSLPLPDGANADPQPCP